MNEMCKYCETSGTCLEIAEYNSIYCRLHRRIPIVIEKTYEELEKENQHLKKQLKQKEDIINKAKEYIINNSLYEEEYDYDYEENIYLSGIHDDDVRRILVEILDNKGDEK